MNPTPDVADVDEVLQVYPRVHAASAVGVGDEMLFGFQPFSGLLRCRGRQQRFPVVAGMALGFEGDSRRPWRSVQGDNALGSPIPSAVSRERLDVRVGDFVQV